MLSCVIQALATWSQFLLAPNRLLMGFLLRDEALFVPVTVSDLLWGQHMTLWNKIRQSHFKNMIPNDAWFGLMYRVPCNLYSVCLSVSDVTEFEF